MKNWPTVTGDRLGHWLYQGMEFPLKHQGWKIHVTAYPRTAAVDIISAVCNEYEATVKFLPSRNDFNCQTGEQRGKWNCIYPSSTLQAFVIAKEISDRLTRAGAKRFSVNRRPPYDKYACRYICVRYGPYISEKLINDHDRLVADIWKKNSFRPPWIDDVWVNFNAMNAMDPRHTMHIGDIGADYPDYRPG